MLFIPQQNKKGGKIKKIMQSLCCIFITVGIVFGSMGLPFTAPPKQAEAQFTDVIGNILTGIGNFLGLVGTNAEVGAQVKEYLLDTVGSVVAKQVIIALTKSTVNWINNGFKGEPTFVRNPGAFAKSIAAEAAVDLIDSSLKNCTKEQKKKATICNPFAIYGIITTISAVKDFDGEKEKFLNNTSWTLDKLGILNPKDFERNFNVGGWDGYLEQSYHPGNNPIGYILQSSEQIEKTAQKAVSEINEELKNNSGFLSIKKCVAYKSENYGEAPEVDPAAAAAAAKAKADAALIAKANAANAALATAQANAAAAAAAAQAAADDALIANAVATATPTPANITAAANADAALASANAALASANAALADAQAKADSANADASQANADADADADAAAAAAEEEKGFSGVSLENLDFSDYSFGVYGSNSPDEADKCARYETVTPGSIIKDQLENVLNSPIKQLEAADELGEVLEAGALYMIGQLAGAGLNKLTSSVGQSINGESGGPGLNESFSNDSSFGDWGNKSGYIDFESKYDSSGTPDVNGKTILGWAKENIGQALLILTGKRSGGFGNENPISPAMQNFKSNLTAFEQQVGNVAQNMRHASEDILPSIERSSELAEAIIHDIERATYNTQLGFTYLDSDSTENITELSGSVLSLSNAVNAASSISPLASYKNKMQDFKLDTTKIIIEMDFGNGGNLIPIETTEINGYKTDLQGMIDTFSDMLEDIFDTVGVNSQSSFEILLNNYLNIFESAENSIDSVQNKIITNSFTKDSATELIGGLSGMVSVLKTAAGIGVPSSSARTVLNNLVTQNQSSTQTEARNILRTTGIENSFLLGLGNTGTNQSVGGTIFSLGSSTATLSPIIDGIDVLTNLGNPQSPPSTLMPLPEWLLEDAKVTSLESKMSALSQSANALSTGDFAESFDIAFLENTSGLINLLENLPTKMKELDDCIPGPNVGWKEKINTEFGRSTSKLVSKLKDGSEEKIEGRDDQYDDLINLIGELKIWMEDLMFNQNMPGVLSMIAHIENFSENKVDLDSYQKTRRDLLRSLSVINSIENNYVPTINALGIPVTLTIEQEAGNRALMARYGSIEKNIPESLFINELINKLTVYDEIQKKTETYYNQCKATQNRLVEDNFCHDYLTDVVCKPIGYVTCVDVEVDVPPLDKSYYSGGKNINFNCKRVYRSKIKDYKNSSSPSTEI